MTRASFARFDQHVVPCRAKARIFARIFALEVDTRRDQGSVNDRALDTELSREL
jgi:hypothetical protein